jgi:methylmalonyl-CoA/ethylmalonyl-CoA epimerase
MVKINGIHHIGKIVKDVESSLREHSKLGFEAEGKIFIDKEQKVKVGKLRIAGKLVIELLEPLDETSPIWRAYHENKGLHHICIEVDSITNFINKLKENSLGFKLTDITVSIFDDRKVCFISTNNRDIIELIE